MFYHCVPRNISFHLSVLPHEVLPSHMLATGTPQRENREKCKWQKNVLPTMFYDPVKTHSSTPNCFASVSSHLACFGNWNPSKRKWRKEQMTKNALRTMLYHCVPINIRLHLSVLPRWVFFSHILATGSQFLAVAWKPEVGGQSRKKTFNSQWKL